MLDSGVYAHCDWPERVTAANTRADAVCALVDGWLARLFDKMQAFANWMAYLRSVLGLRFSRQEKGDVRPDHH